MPAPTDDGLLKQRTADLAKANIQLGTIKLYLEEARRKAFKRAEELDVDVTDVSSGNQLAIFLSPYDWRELHDMISSVLEL